MIDFANDCYSNVNNRFYGEAFVDPKLRRWVNIVMCRFNKKFKYLGDGRHRVVYQHKNWVIKVPHNEAGVQSNIDEYRKFKRNKFDRQCGCHVAYARCRLLKGTFLVMEYVLDTPHTRKSRPDWSDFIDCRQVGLNRRGEYVAYDFGG